MGGLSSLDRDALAQLHVMRGTNCGPCSQILVSFAVYACCDHMAAVQVPGIGRLGDGGFITAVLCSKVPPSPWEPWGWCDLTPGMHVSAWGLNFRLYSELRCNQAKERVMRLAATDAYKSHVPTLRRCFSPAIASRVRVACAAWHHISTTVCCASVFMQPVMICKGLTSSCLTMPPS